MCVDADRVTRTGTVSVVEPTMSVMRSAGRLVVDPRLHAGEIARFTSHVVCGPAASDCNIWTGAIGADGYGRYYLTRQGMGLCVRPHRYALAMACIAGGFALSDSSTIADLLASLLGPGTASLVTGLAVLSCTVRSCTYRRVTDTVLSGAVGVNLYVHQRPPVQPMDSQRSSRT